MSRTPPRSHAEVIPIPASGAQSAGLVVSAAASAIRSGTRSSLGRFLTQARTDSQFRLAVAIAVSVIALEVLSGGVGPRPVAVLASTEFILVQIALMRVRSTRWWLPLLRLALSLGFVVLANVLIDPTGTWPFNALQIPVVGLAASLGGVGATAIAGLGVAAALVPLVMPGTDAQVQREALAIATAAIVIGTGSRRIVLTLERSATRLRASNMRDRRRALQLGALEAVGRVLARLGPTRDGLDSVMELLEETFGYRYPSVYIWDGSMLQLGAQRNYQFPIESIPGDVGVVGRVVRTQQAILLPDARGDPDFQSADPGVVGEIAVPLLSDGEFLGILNVETNRERLLDDDDFATMLIVGDRLAAALALGRERQKLTERTALLDRLTTFAATLSSSLDTKTVNQLVVTGAAIVVPADMLALVLVDRSTGEYVTAAVSGGDEGMAGRRILPGEGISGRAIEAGALVVDDHLERASFPRTTAEARIADVLAAMGVPLLENDGVVGALAWLREDISRVFTPQEQEIAILLASRVVLAIANATLHEAAQEAAITDVLSGLHNRRHFDASLLLGDALRARAAPRDRRERSAILFDLDHFGTVNKRHGHQAGDHILRRFSDVIRARVRASDLLARYGGEEFVVILDGASRDEAVRLAEEIRIAFRQVGIDASDSGLPIVTVSAGCAGLDRSEILGSVLLERADVGLAMAKAGGRDQVVAA